VVHVEALVLLVLGFGDVSKLAELSQRDRKPLFVAIKNLRKGFGASPTTLTVAGHAIVRCDRTESSRQQAETFIVQVASGERREELLPLCLSACVILRVALFLFRAASPSGAFVFSHTILLRSG
jgi:hypothetical protein